MMTDKQLQEWVERVSLRDFGAPFLHRATFNRRLTSSGGRYDLRSHDIDINPAQLEQHGADEVEKIIKHELCHYHLHLQGRGYRHRDREFKELLARVGGTRFCRRLERRGGGQVGGDSGAGTGTGGQGVGGAGTGTVRQGVNGEGVGASGSGAGTADAAGRLGASGRVAEFRYVLKCRVCAAQYPRRIRSNPERYVCSRCRGALDLFEIVLET